MRRFGMSVHRYGRRFFGAASRVLICVALASMSVVANVASPAIANAPGAITLDKTSSGAALLGGRVDYHLAAGNPETSGVEQYNLSYVDILPAGVSYVPGSTTPSGFGDPQVIVASDDPTATPPVTHQVLVWSNVADLTPGAVRSLSFSANVDAGTYGVGSSVINTAMAYASSDPREVPAFDDHGALSGGVAVVQATDSTSTGVTAIKLTKGEASPEQEMLRGVNDNQSVYTLSVANNDVAETSDLVVTDYLPAGLEFLGCGGPFNSAGPEYPGAANTVGAVSDCDQPTSVDTVEDPAGYPAGVYTKVTWTISSIGKGDTVAIRYAAGIPQRANTMVWSGARPSADSGEQAANLDNNSGASTRETGTEKTLQNYASVSGTFEGKKVADTATHAVTAEDLRLVKSVSPSAFAQGQLATYTLDVAASEYDDLADLLITDVIPNGMCPIDSVRNWTAVAECAAESGHGPTNATITNVVANSDGSFTVTFAPTVAALSHDGHLVITYQALMMASYRNGAPTSANDEFTNHAVISASSTARDGTDAPDGAPVTVYDDSSATIASAVPVLTKLRMKNASTMACSAKTDDYTVADDGGAAEDAFAEGDRVCFLLVVRFPKGVDTRNAQLTDFLPSSLAYESSQQLSPVGPVAAMSPASPTDYVTWDLGTVSKGAVAEFVVSALVTKPPTLTSAANPKSLDQENLAKFRYLNSAGLSDSLRDSVGLAVAPPAGVGVTKGVQSINATVVDSGAKPANVDGSTVRAGDAVVFRVDVQNLSKVGDSNAAVISSPDVWDVLPTGVTCSDIQAISDAGTCYDASAAGRPSLSSGDAASSIIRWQLGAGFTLDPQAFGKLTYTLVVPAGASVSAVYNNTAAVTSFTTKTNTGTTATHNPTANISAAVPAAAQDVPPASDTSSVVVPDAQLAKSSVTDITESGNAAAQAVVGEDVAYTIRLTIPARTSVYNGVLADPLPTGMVLVGPASGFYSATGRTPATAPLPTGVSLDSVSGALTLGSAYTNSTDTDQLFEVRIPARVDTLAANTHGVARTNTATFVSDTAANGGTAIPPRTASSTVSVVEPSPTLTKSGSPSTVAGGSVVTYSLTAANGSGRPPLHDSWVVDCLPGTLAFGSFTQVPTGTTATTEAGTGSNGCATGFTRIAWKIADLAGGTSLTAKYTATVTAIPAAGATYKNTATLTGSTLNDGKTDPTAADNPIERTFTASASKSLTVTGATINKTANPTQLAPGQSGSYTVTVTLPANVAFYDSAVMDALPPQMTFGSTTSLVCINADGSDCGAGVPGTQLGPTSSVVGWLIGDLAPSRQVRTITIVYTAKMSASGNVAGNSRTNTASYRWNTIDAADPTGPSTSWGSNAVSKAATTTVIEPSMSISKTANGVARAAVSPGDRFTYVVTATNAGTGTSAPAYNLTMTDTVPAGVIVDPASLAASGGTLSGVRGDGGGGVITWTVAGPLAKGSSLTFSYTGTLVASSSLHNSDIETNTATVSHYESQPSDGKTGYAPVSAAAVVTPQFPHVTATKTAAAGPAYLGKPKAWTITLTNDGAAPALHVDAVDTLPANWTYDAGSATVVVAGGAATAAEPVLGANASGHQVLTWSDLGAIPADRAKPIVITFTATPTDPGAVADPGVGSSTPHTNVVSASAQDATGASGNATGAYNGPAATAATHIDSADVQLTKTSNGAATAGQSLAYSLVVKNNGPDQAVGPFTVTDTLPEGLGAVSWAGPGWACSQATTTVTCQRSSTADTLASGATFPAITVTVAIPAGVAEGASLTNSAAVSASTYDPKTDNNTSTVTDTVHRVADLGIVKRTSGTITAGAEATYSLDVTNHGPSDSAGPIVVTDTLPRGTSFVAAAGAGWKCDFADPLLSCTRSDGLADGQAAPQITVRVAVAADVTGELINTAGVSGPETDPKTANNTSSVTDQVRTIADLALTKNHVGPFTPGDQGTYEFTVTNNGPSDAAAPVTITDQLAAELTFVSDDSSDWACAADADNLLTCRDGRGLAVGKTATFRITVAIDSSFTQDVVNSATVDSPTVDPHAPNNTDGDSTGVNVSADLGIKKSHAGDAVAGKAIDFRLAVTNHGKSDTPGPITVTDTLPAGMSFVSGSGDGWDCSASGRVITCTHLGGLAANAEAPDIAIRARVAADAGPSVMTNVASVAGIAPDPNPVNNTDSDQVTVSDQANVSITKTAEASSVLAGSAVTWLLTVANDGPSDADNVQITDALPAGLSYDGIEADSHVRCADANPVDCWVSSMPSGARYRIAVHARVGAAVADRSTITNRAGVSTSTSGDDLEDNADSASVTVMTAADLSLTKTHLGTSVVAGTQVDFTLAVHNAGPSDAAADVVIVDNLPAGMSYVGSAGTAWSCAAGEADAAGQKVTCTLSDGADVQAGRDAPPLVVTAQVDPAVDPAALVEGTLTNTARVASSTEDPHPANNPAADAVPVTTSADLSIMKSHAGSARIGDPVQFTLQVANTGPSTARSVVVSDPLPDGLTLVSAGGDGWTCKDDDHRVLCTLNRDLPSGATAAAITVTTTVSAVAYPQVKNTATVSSLADDPTPDNNTSTDQVTVPAQVDLGITKTHTPDVLQVGSRATYTLTVANSGPTDDPGPVTVADSLPAGLTFVSGAGDGWSCSASGQDVTCSRPDGLHSGDHTSIAVLVGVGPAAYSSVTNIASVSSPAEDIDPGNNTAADPATVLPLSNVEVTKKLTSISDDEATWSISVTNHGPNPSSSGAVVTDRLPDQLRFLAFTGDGWMCATAGQLVTCSHGRPLAVGETVTVRLRTAIANGASGTITNSATVVGGNTSTASGTVPPRGGLAFTGGVAVGLGLIGAGLLVVGIVLVRMRRRHPRVG